MANQKNINKQTKKIVDSYLSQLKNAGIEVSDAYVFGSQAKGTDNKHSDIDLAVVSPHFGKSKHEELVRLFKLLDKDTRWIEPLPFSPEEMEDKDDPLVKEVRRYGISVIS